MNTWSMIDQDGQRKYLNDSEVDRFLSASKKHDPLIHSFCWILSITGCRISEALSLNAGSIDFESGSIIFRSLKKRGRRIFRSVPIPASLLSHLKHWIRAGTLDPLRFWSWSRMTAYRKVCLVMDDAVIRGAHATPKGLRHGFGVHAIQSGIPLNLVQRWLGHADIKTTAIYTDVMGPEERSIASRMWKVRGSGASGHRAAFAAVGAGEDRNHHPGN